MKRFLFAVLLTLLLCFPVFAMKNEPDGFGGIKWGDKLSQHPDLVPSENGMGYIRPNDRLEIQLSNVSGVLYAFDEQEGFYQAFVGFPLFSDIEQIIFECAVLWGDVDDTAVGKNDYGSDTLSAKWKGRQTTTELIITVSVRAAQLSIHDNERWQRVAFRNENDKPNS